MKDFFKSFKFWALVLGVLIFMVLWDDDFDEKAKTEYVKHRMVVNNIAMDQIDADFKSGTFYADVCYMDDSQNYFDAEQIKMVVYKENVATFTAKVVADTGTKNPFEATFKGNVYFWDTDGLRGSTDEVKYYLKRREFYSSKPIKAFKDDAVLTGLGFSYNMDNESFKILRRSKIRYWGKNKESKPSVKEEALPLKPLEEILKEIPLKNQNHVTIDSGS